MGAESNDYLQFSDENTPTPATKKRISDFEINLNI